MLVAARLRHIASTRWDKRRYLVMHALLNPAKQEALRPTMNGGSATNLSLIPGSGSI